MAHKIVFLIVAIIISITRATVVTEVNFGTRITWKVLSYPTGFTRDQIDTAIRAGLRMWTSVCNIDFHQIDTNPDMVFKFLPPRLHNLDCEYDFDDDDLGHVKTVSRDPVEIHITDKPYSKNWTMERTLKQHHSLITLIAHEIGHVLGFRNNDIMSSIMYKHILQTTELNPDDVDMCQKKYGMKNRINSACPAENTRVFYPRGRIIGSELKAPTCGVVYGQPHCYVGSPQVWWNVLISQTPDLQQIRLYPDSDRHLYNWLNRISSFQVNPGCKMKLCTGKNYTGHCMVETGDRFGKNVPTMDERFDNAIGSMWCTCGQGSDENITASLFDTSKSWMNRLKRAAPVPSKLSDDQETCGVLVEKFIVEGRNKLIPKGSRYAYEEAIWGWSTWSKPNALTYIATRPQCSMKYCSEEYFFGTCITLGPNRYFSDDFIIIKSLLCTCNTTDSSAPIQELGNITLTTTTVQPTTTVLPNEGTLEPEINRSIGNITLTTTTIAQSAIRITVMPTEPDATESDTYPDLEY